MNRATKVILIKCSVCDGISFPWQRGKGVYVCSHCGTKLVQKVHCLEICKSDYDEFKSEFNIPIYTQSANYVYFINSKFS